MHIQQTHFYIYTQQVLNQLNRDSEKNPFLLAVESILGAQPEKICLFGSILLFPTVISNLHKSIVAYVLIPPPLWYSQGHSFWDKTSFFGHLVHRHIF